MKLYNVSTSPVFKRTLQYQMLIFCTYHANARSSFPFTSGSPPPCLSPSPFPMSMSHSQTALQRHRFFPPQLSSLFLSPETDNDCSSFDRRARSERESGKTRAQWSRGGNTQLSLFSRVSFQKVKMLAFLTLIKRDVGDGLCPHLVLRILSHCQI